MELERASSWRGIYAALLTPLRKDESLDEEAAANLVDRLLGEGQAGIYLAGCTGEEHGLDDDVRVRLFRAAVEASAGRGRLIAHIGGVPTKRAVHMASLAVEAGVDAVAALPPHGGRYSFNELLGYYREIARRSSKPLFVYHIPEVSGYDLSLDQLSRLMKLPNVAGMKFTCENLFLLERLVTRFPEKVFFHGKDEMLLQGLTAGATGAIGTTYNLLGPVAIAVAERFRAGDIAGARAPQSALNAFVEAYRQAPNGLRAFKALAAETFGWLCSVSPAPGRMPTAGSLEPMRRAMESALQKFPGKGTGANPEASKPFERNSP